MVLSRYNSDILRAKFILPFHRSRKHSLGASLGSVISEERDKHSEQEISKKKEAVVRKLQSTVMYGEKTYSSMLDWSRRSLLFVHLRVYLTVGLALGPICLIVLQVPHWGGRPGRLTMFPVGEALMFILGGISVQFQFPFICCVSFNVYNHLRSRSPSCW